jgi:hypothetical protein
MGPLGPSIKIRATLDAQEWNEDVHPYFELGLHPGSVETEEGKVTIPYQVVLKKHNIGRIATLSSELWGPGGPTTVTPGGDGTDLKAEG